MIERREYLKQIVALRDIDVIKVVTGIRRCGKSTLFELYTKHLLANGVGKNDIFSYNFEDFELHSYIEDPMKLHNELTAAAESGRNIYVFLDEVQNLRDFEKLINSLRLRPNIDVYVTGSNAFLLSGELATLLTGRYIQIHMLPFSFAEYVMSRTGEPSEFLFNDYVKDGGFPGALALPEQLRQSYVRDIYNSIMQKDVMLRNSWRKADHFDRLVRFVFDSIGSPLSINKITNTFKSFGFQISSRTVETYMDAVCESYLFYKVPRYNIRGRVILGTQEKYYAADLGLKMAVLGQPASVNVGHNLENIVFLELIRRGNEVYIGKLDENEVDFVAKSPNGEVQYFQVAYTAKEEATMKRELLPLQKIKDNYQKTLLTTDEIELNKDGIALLNVKKWLLNS